MTHHKEQNNPSEPVEDRMVAKLKGLRAELAKHDYATAAGSEAYEAIEAAINKHKAHMWCYLPDTFLIEAWNAYQRTLE